MVSLSLQVLTSNSEALSNFTLERHFISTFNLNMTMILTNLFPPNWNPNNSFLSLTMTATQEKEEKRLGRIEAAFRKFDLDGDGYLR